jgi:cell wall-associated NlpC family hydrolase
MKRIGLHGMVDDMRTRRTALIGTLALATALGLGSLSTSSAAPRKDLQQVAQQVRELQMEAGAATELVHQAQIRLAGIQSDLDSIQNRADRERADMRVAVSTIDDLARAAYSSGGIDPTLEVLMAEDPAEFLAQAAVMSQIEQTQLAQLRKVQTTRLRLAQTEAEITDREVNAQKVRDEMASAQNEADARLSAAEEVLASLQEEERQRLAQLAEERRQQQLAAAADAEAALAADSGGSSSDPGPTGGGSTESDGGSNGGSRAQIAVQYALAQVGEPYSYSARPPDSWDCSKLTTAAWAQAGVSITPLSFTQWDQTRRVPVSDIQPGDLVFYFGSGAHHVAIYIGNGKMVSASNPGDGVEIIDFLGPWYNERFSGVGRVI